MGSSAPMAMDVKTARRYARSELEDRRVALEDLDWG